MSVKMFCYVNSVLVLGVGLGGITCNEFIYFTVKIYFFYRTFFFLQISTYRNIKLFRLLNRCLLFFIHVFFFLNWHGGRAAFAG